MITQKRRNQCLLFYILVIRPWAKEKNGFEAADVVKRVLVKIFECKKNGSRIIDFHFFYI